MLAPSDWLLLTLVCAVGAMTPGISLAVITRHTLRHGHRAGMAAGLAHGLGIALWATATVAGLSLLLRRYPQLEWLLALGGSVFLLWMAVQSWRAAGRPLAAEPALVSGLHSAMRDGFSIAFLNPKVALFFIAVFSQFLSTDLTLGGRAQMVATSAIIDGGWYALVAMLLGRSRILPWLRDHHAGLERGTAIILLVVAISVLAGLAGR